MIAAVIVAAGSGERFGERKQFFRIGGRPLIWYALSPFLGSREVERVALVLPAGVTDDDLVGIPLDENPKVSLVTGGERRQDSVYRGLMDLPADNGVIVVHDGARPLLGPRLLSALIEEARRGHSVVPVVPVNDTLKEVLGDTVVRTLGRERIFGVQTPQAFPARIIRKAHENAREKGMDSTDDAQLVEALGVAVHVIPGDPANIKVTTREDLALVSLLLRDRGHLR